MTPAASLPSSRARKLSALKAFKLEILNPNDEIRKKPE
jgi:hypothetical protein